MPDRLRLVLVANLPGCHPAAWRQPGVDPLATFSVDAYQQVVALAESGGFDAVLFADGLALGRHETPGYAFDPAHLVAASLAVTERIGLIGTVSTTYTEPYAVARTWAGLDLAGDGRVGVNLVATADDAARRNFTAEPPLSNVQRYERAAAFADVLLALWSSWTDGAIVADKASGQLFDRSRIVAPNLHDPHFDVVGPLQVPPSRQGRPALVQAGASEEGRAFAATYADAVFTAQRTERGAQTYRADLRRRATRVGRGAAPAVLPGLHVFLAGTDGEALDHKAELDALIDQEDGLHRVATLLGVPAEALSLDEPVPLDELGHAQPPLGSYAAESLDRARDRSVTVRDLIAIGTGAHRQLTGGPKTVADAMIRGFEAGAGDGWCVQLSAYPDGLRLFVDEVVPLLSATGVVTDPGTRALRERLA